MLEPSSLTNFETAVVTAQKGRVRKDGESFSALATVGITNGTLGVNFR